MSVRRAARATAVVAALGLLVGSTLSPSNATTTTTGAGSATATAVQNNVGTLTVTPVPGGLASIVTNILNPVISGLTGASGALTTVTNTLNGVVTGVTGNTLKADSTTSSTQVTRPATPPPNCGQAPWTKSTGTAVGNCYQVASQNISGGTSLGLTLNTVNGYATGDANGYIGWSSVSAVGLSVLSNLVGGSIGNLGVVSSTAQCSNASVCSATESVSGGSLLGGKLTYNVPSTTCGASTAVACLNGTPVTVGGLTIPSHAH